MRTLTNQIFEKAKTIIPGGVNSPVRSFKSLNMTPMIVDSGKGDMITDVDGNQYIDFCLSWGSLILGHANDQIIKAVTHQLEKGSSFGIATKIEVELADMIVKAISSIEKVRFLSSGTEATMTAIRLARGYTERAKIVKFTGHYHGHADPFLIQAGSGVASINPMATSKGVSKSILSDTITLNFNDFSELNNFFLRSPEAKDVAAVIVEPVTANMGTVLPEKGFLELLRDLTRKNGSLLICDEVVTGFRFGYTSVSDLFKIDPDLICFGKIIGGGFPAALVGGKKEILDHLAPIGQVYQAGTLSGNPVAMRAGLETLKILQEPNFYKDLEEKARFFLEPIQACIQDKNCCLQHFGSMFNIFFGVKKVRSKKDAQNIDGKMFERFFKYLFARGVYISPSSQEAWFLSSAHTKEHLLEAQKHMIDFLTKEL